MRMIQTFHSDYSVEQVKMLLSSLCEKFSFIIPTEGRIGYNLHGPFLTLIYVPKEMRMVRKYKALLLQGRDGKAVIYGTYWIPIWEAPFYAAAMALLAFFLLGAFDVLPMVIATLVSVLFGELVGGAIIRKETQVAEFIKNKLNCTQE